MRTHLPALCTETLARHTVFETLGLIVGNSPGKRTRMHLCVRVHAAISLIQSDSVWLGAGSLQCQPSIAGCSCPCLGYK